MCEGRQRFVRLVLELRYDDGYRRPFVVEESMRTSSDQVRTDDRWTNRFLDVLDDQIGARVVIHVGWHGWVVHRIG